MCPKCAQRRKQARAKTSLTCIFTAYFSVELPGIEPGAKIGFYLLKRAI
jgi:hypothetical protein